MPLSRLDNFLKNVKGNILYVDPNNLDATDGIENQGNSMARPFKTIQRALIEAARFSYQKGKDNDRFEKTTIYLAPGPHHIDNRPGWIPNGGAFTLRSGVTSSDLTAYSNTTNFDIFDTNNDLYKVNSIHGGVVIPRGVSIVGQDLRKCVIRPIYVPNPENNLIERSAIFRVTGGCYMNSFTIKDADTNKSCYKDYTNNPFKPTFSHHKLTAFEYADGRNDVNINDDFLTYTTDRTDLDMYYEKIGIVYGPGSGREITPDYPNANVDINPKIDEFRIVGPVEGSVGINSIKAGDGVTASTIIDVQLSEAIFGLNTDTNVIINNVTDPRYNGTFLVTEIVSTNVDGTTGFKYEVPNAPADALPNPTGSSIELSTDTVTSASPYIFNVSLRSIFGMCGMHADGSKADGFKSMVVAQYTGVGLQVDDKAFVKYNSTSGTFDDFTTVPNLHTDIDAVYRPEYANFHIKASNNSLIQLVSIFAIGYANQFVVESGGDFSVTNSNSNFGQTALISRGYKDNVFAQDDVGYVTQVIPPRTLKPETTTIEFSSIDISKTTSVANTSRLYLYEETNVDEPPITTIQGYRLGAKKGDELNVIIPESGVPTNFRARIVMDDTAYATKKITGCKRGRVGRNVSAGNSITNSIFTLTEDHQFIQGESVRVISNDGRLPDGLEHNKVYFAIVDGLGNDKIQLAQTLNDSLTGNNISINNLGDTLVIESRVSDKIAGDIGHPVQYDTTENQWYVNVSGASTENNIYSKITQGGSSKYEQIGLESYTSTHNAPILFTQAVDDTTGGGKQTEWLEDYVDAVQAIESNATATLQKVGAGGHAAFTSDAYLQEAIRFALISDAGTGTINNSQFTIVPSDGETHTVDSTSYPVMGSLYVPTGITSTSIDVVVAFHGTVTEGGSSTIADAAANTLTQLINSSNLNIRDKIIFSAAYPQDHISATRQYNLSGVGTETSTFLMGDNIVYTRAAVGWVKNSLNAYIAAQGGSKTIKDVYLFGHSQGGALVTKMNTLETGITGVVANSPGPIQFDQTCAAQPGGTSCSKVAAIYGAAHASLLGDASPRTFLERQVDTRQSTDRIHQVRFVIPSTTGSDSARPPLDSYVLQESGDVSGATNTEVALEFNPGSVTMSNDAQLRNFRFIAGVDYRGGIAYFDTEKPHGLSIGSTVEINNVTSTNFPTVGVGNSGYNGVYEVTGISSAKTFSVNQIYTDPGTFTNNTSQRTTSLPTFKKKNLPGNYQCYDVTTINEYKNGEQDGIYYLSLINCDVKPTVSPFNTKDFSFQQPVKNLYPQLDRDNPISMAPSAACYAVPDNIGEVQINESQNSLTGETLEKLFDETGIGVGVTGIISNNVGTAYTIFTEHDHGLNRITRPVIDNPGAGYGDGSTTIQYYYNAKLENISAGSIGRNATALVTVDGTSSGEIIDIAIMDGGSAYVEGGTFRVVGIATTTGFTVATGSVNRILDNRNDTINVSGINDYDGKRYNGQYRITSISGIKEFEVEFLGAESPGISTTGLGPGIVGGGSFSVNGPSYDTASFVYNRNVGLATITTDYANSFRVNNGVRISGAASTFFNGVFACCDKIGLTTVVLNVGVNTVTPSTSGTVRIHPAGIYTNDGDLVIRNGRLHGRETSIFAGISTNITGAITSKTTDTINVANMANYAFQIGDFLQVDDEIMRIKTTPSRTATDTELKVFRGVFGTIADTHVDGATINRVRFYPLEFRRNSIIRASAHTFEYIGYGPGNYSTAFPSKQTKQLTLDEQINVQSQAIGGGVVNYTGMNDRGDFYIGNKRIASNTGREQVYGTPIQTIVGEDPYTIGSKNETSEFNFVEGSVLKVARNFVVDGGDSRDILSQFNGPVQFSQKVTNTSEEGFEANSMFLQGNASVSRQITVGIATPSNAGNPGDVVFNANPANGGYVGWVYTTNNEWKTFGDISS